MGYMACIAPCLRCRRPFSFHPERVPSIRVDGERRPMCQECMEWFNSEREKAGLDPVPILPGAYDPVEDEV